MKWGDRYGAEYVNRLYAMVRRNVTGEFRMVCMTDDARGVRGEVETWECPTVGLPAPHCNRGWRKVSLFAERLGDLEGQALYLDLDVVVTGELDPFFEHEPDEDFVIMRNPTQRGLGIGNTSVYRFRVGSHPEVLAGLEADGARLVAKHVNSQTYISRTLGERPAGAMAYWPDAWCVSFKVDCIPPLPARWWNEPALPEGARVVIFTGKPDPEDVVEGRWPAPFHKRWYKRFKAPGWVREHWRE